MSITEVTLDQRVPAANTSTASARHAYRRASNELRENAGIGHREEVASVRTLAEVGAAARRLRASNHFEDDRLRFAPPAPRAETAPVAETTVPVPTVVAPEPPAADDGDAPLVFDLRTPTVIDLDAQVACRNAAADADNDWRRFTLSQRAAHLLAAIDDARPRSERTRF